MKIFLSFINIAIIFFLTINGSKGQMLPGLAGGNLPKGAEREEDIKPWLTLGNKTNEADENIISGKWTGLIFES